MKMKINITTLLLLLCVCVAEAVQYGKPYKAPQYNDQPYAGNGQKANASGPTVHQSYIGNGQIVNEYTLASVPYAEDDNSASVEGPRRASRPGGGTGVIPNPTPVGDGLFFLVFLAAFYALLWPLYRTIRAILNKLLSD